MIHTEPLQCEICGFTCRSASPLAHEETRCSATYQFSCSIFLVEVEKKDCVVAHKARVTRRKPHASRGHWFGREPSRAQDSQVDQLSQEGQDGQQVAQVSQMGHVTQQVSHQVVLLGQDQSLHTMQVPVTIALSPIDPPSPADNQQQTHLQLQMPVQFVQAAQQPQQPQIQQLTLHSSSVVTQHQPQLQPLQSYSSQQQSQGQAQILQMTFQPPQDPASTNGDSFILDNPVLASSSPSANSLQQAGEQQ
ncbi:E3 ubiquitin-protein ligase ZFP91-like protein [Lates japonicus]|uniref:E3 ubiquitin-protein ligase ZFP91-like protein n=1 Tax=Lates japonicus TaxID=270547 RepID=A0AAD3NLB9_LATJO|nr:E3 ubiquitin-protein ligase ZFP91-like protein [Lates japonicus]